MEIRFANAGDIPGLLRLLRQVGQVHHHIRPDLFRQGALKYDAPALEALLRDPLRPVFAAVEDGTLLGYCFCILQTTRDDSVLCDRRVLYIDDLCVEEACRGRGVAKALYAHTLDYARSQSCQAVTLNVWCGNDSALAFYEKAGLKPQKIGMEAIL